MKYVMIVLCLMMTQANAECRTKSVENTCMMICESQPFNITQTSILHQGNCIFQEKI
jgi:hypothetical protein